MGLQRVLIANRGEIAIRIARTAAEMGLGAVAVYSEDDARSLHVLRAEGGAERLPGQGAAAYLDQEAVLAAAERAGCDAVHPGYGFLSESAGFARRAVERGLTFVGPAPETLDLFGDKVRARAFAERCVVPVLPGTDADGGLDAARAFLASRSGGAGGEGGVMIKASAGGGGRGMRAVRTVEELGREWPRCREEARRAFGRGDLYVERLVPRARHIEVQVAGDGTGAAVDFGERECSLQRRRQKIVEIAPAPNLPPDLRSRIVQAAVSLTKAARFANLGTFEFLVDEAGAWYFIEANPRLQVEHTVTEEVTGVDLVRLQFALAGGGPLPVRDSIPAPRGYAVQARVNLEEMRPDGTVRPAGGVIGAFEPPSGPGVRVDTSGYSGYAPNPRFDPLIAKVVVRTDGAPAPGEGGAGAEAEAGGAAGFAAAAAKLRRALGELRVTGTATNAGFLRNLLAHPEVTAGRFHTGFVEAHLADFLDAEPSGGTPEPAPRATGGAPSSTGAGYAGTRAGSRGPIAAAGRPGVDPLVAGVSSGPGGVHPGTSGPEEGRRQGRTGPAPSEPEPAAGAVLAGSRVDARDPLAVLVHGKSGASGGAPAGPGPEAGVGPGSGADGSGSAPSSSGPPEREGEGSDADRGRPEPGAVLAPMQGTVIEVLVGEGDAIHFGRELLVMEAMKMQHVVAAERTGRVRRLAVREGDTVAEGSPLLVLDEGEVERPAADAAEDLDLDAIRPDLAEVLERRALTRDERRPEAVARRRRTGQRTARENVEDLVDPGSFIEYGALVLAARRQRHPIDELIRRTPADGLVAGIGRVNGGVFGDERARCLVMAYDYTVLAGTQGKFNHHKKDRMFALAEQWRLPMVFFTEGGGGRPGDTDIVFAADLHIPAFHLLGRLSGLVPLVGIASGRCFAGNAVVLGCCDVVIATRNANIGMGGPAMIEGGGLGVFRPEEVGPMDVQVPNGVVDVPVADEAEAVAAAKRYLSYFQGAVDDWTCADQRRLRHVVPEDRLRTYDVRNVVELLADEGSVLELRKEFGPGMVTALARIEGRPIGIVANNPIHLAGAVDSDGADKAARFMQICDAFDVPILCLCDTPGNMVGPEAEKTALVRHCCRLYVIGASVTVPMFTVVLRKSYGLGAQAMAAGSFHAPFFAVSWPTGEFGGMGLEGAVKLGYRNELAAIDDPAARMARYEEMVAAMYEQGKALNTATLFEVDDVIDPADTRRWVVEGLRACPPPAPRSGKKRPCIDTW